MPKPKSKIVIINQKEVELFYIDALAFALGRTCQTVRKWEIAGIIPKAIFRDKGKNRMYTQTQIDIIVSIAEECGIKQGAPIKGKNQFAIKVHKALSEYNKNFLKKTD